MGVTFLFPIRCSLRASSDTGDVLAAGILLATGDDNVGPSPARAGPASANNYDVVTSAGYGT
jgi:hypothetical protein